MQKEINIKNKQQAIRLLNNYKRKRMALVDIKFLNTKLKEINALVGKNLFVKNDLYVNSDTLHDIMQPIGDKSHHNYHGLSPEEILRALNNLVNPYCVYKAKFGRYGIITAIKRESGETIIVIIEVGSGLIGQMDANINKFVTMYPKTDIGQVISNKESILYLNLQI